jgi:hypothetical protein
MDSCRKAKCTKERMSIFNLDARLFILPRQPEGEIWPLMGSDSDYEHKLYQHKE